MVLQLRRQCLDRRRCANWLRSMLRWPEGMRISMAVQPIDMRRSFHGLCAIIAEALRSNPLSDDLRTYCKRLGSRPLE